ncbi:MAG: hypothetical protein IKI31_01235, partial [Treponema sp.]|nr:hypothetical protein [Treponema sp.]
IIELKQFIDIPDDITNFADALTIYGIRTRYPSSIFVNETQTNVAIAHAKKIKAWAENVIK